MAEHKRSKAKPTITHNTVPRFCASGTAIQPPRTTWTGCAFRTPPTSSVDQAEDPGGGSDRCPTSISRRRADTRSPSRYATTRPDCTICTRASSRERTTSRLTTGHTPLPVRVRAPQQLAHRRADRVTSESGTKVRRHNSVQQCTQMTDRRLCRQGW